MIKPLITHLGAMLFTFIAFIILVFLLLGQCHTNLTFSNVYLAEVHYNQTTTALNDTAPSLRMGFRGACIVTAKETNCSDYGLLQQRWTATPLTKVLLADVAVSWHKLTHYHLVLVGVIVGLVKMGLILYTMVPRLPRHFQVLLVCVGVAAVEVILVGALAIAHHAATLAAIYTAGEASGDQIAITRGGRANGMTWAAVTLALLSVVAMIALCVADLRRQQAGSHETKPSLRDAL